MSLRLRTSITRALPATLLALAALAGAQATPAGAATTAKERLAFAASMATPGQRLAPEIVGGQEATIEQFPWQVFVLVVAVEGGNVTEAACGGSILSPTVVLTAAHCVTHEGTTVRYPATDMFVVAGVANVAEAVEQIKAPLDSQMVGVASLRTHPYYSVSPIRDDVAVLTLGEELNLAGPTAKAIPLVATGATPPAGTPLSLSGFGKQNGAPTASPNWRLYSTALTAMSSDACRDLVAPESAVTLCAIAATSSACQGDSGGPLTEGSPAVEVGTVDYGLAGCPVNNAGAFANVAAPEVRAFIEGSETPPIAPRQTQPAVINITGSPAVTLSPETCEPGGWTGSPSFTYTFENEAATPQVFQSGPSNVFTPPAGAAGSSIVCIVQASNAGGVSTARSGTVPALASDTTQPQGTISGLSCHGQSCALAIQAHDPYSVALTVQGTAIYKVTTRCPAKKGHKHNKHKQPVCHKAVNTVVSATPVSSSGGFTTYQATLSGLPYGQLVVLRGVVTNAAGLRPTSAPLRAVTLRRPSKAAHRPHKKTARHGHRKR
jgi:secreted trypsin-like serine protease